MRYGVAAIVLAAGSCSSPPAEDAAVAACERYIQGKLRSPSTYKQAWSHTNQYPTEHAVIVAYDAVNAYNAPIRAQQVCYFPLRNGEPETAMPIDHDAVIFDRASANGSREANPPPRP